MTTKQLNKANKGLKLRFKPYELLLKYPFKLATSTRTTTPVLLTELEFDGFIGYGEASMPPYLGESHESVIRFLQQLDLEQFHDPFQLEEILTYVDGICEGNTAAKASIDIALHDLIGKLKGESCYESWGYNASDTPVTSFTIGIDDESVVRKKVKEAEGYKLLKIKLGRSNDKEMIQVVRSLTDVPISVDANQGWTDRTAALEMSYWLKEQGVIFVEQPMPKTEIDGTAWLTENSPLPIIADEGIQRLADLERLKGVFSGVNIKLMKCTGLNEARKMMDLARKMEMKVMIGCMTETSCAVSAAAQLSPKVDWADLDGNLLISNDPYTGVQIEDGKIKLLDLPGIGVGPK